MPLKHLTETLLIVLLGAVIILTGVVVASLPHLPAGFMPWAIVSFLTVLYPAVLYPLLKRNRADYAFRSLHFVPFVMTIIWLVIEIIMLKDPRFIVAQRVYTWGLTAPAVLVAFVLMVAFVLHVIRRRIPRITFLTLLLVPFLASAYVNENTDLHINDRLASVLWTRFDEIAVVPVNTSSSSSMTTTVAISSKGEKNLSASSVPEEEEWRQKLRDVEEGKTHSLANVSVKGTTIGVKAAAQLASSSAAKPVAVNPGNSHLPKSGGEFESIALFLVAAYCGTLHMRARRRALAFA
jgi:hypothetical protein